MAKMAEFHLKVEVEQEKIDDLNAAEERFRKASQEFEEATVAYRRAVLELRHSLKVKKDEGPE